VTTLGVFKIRLAGSHSGSRGSDDDSAVQGGISLVRRFWETAATGVVAAGGALSADQALGDAGSGDHPVITGHLGVDESQPLAKPHHP